MQVTESLSWDAIDQSDQDTAYSTVPVKGLNNLPPHRLLLKKGAPIMASLLLTIKAKQGILSSRTQTRILCNVCMYYVHNVYM
jgi:hypothetical protein